MRLTLKHDGDPNNARVVDADTGETIENVLGYTLTKKERNHMTEELVVRLAIVPDKYWERWREINKLPGERESPRPSDKPESCSSSGVQ